MLAVDTKERRLLEYAFVVGGQKTLDDDDNIRKYVQDNTVQ